MESLRETPPPQRRAAASKKPNLGKEAIDLHRRLRGKIEIKSKVPIRTMHDISVAYTPGVAEVCRAIAQDREKAYEYTSKWNNIAIVTDGTRTLGLGKLGPEAALPVMEGKALLYKQFGNVDAFPICLATTNIDEIIATVKNIAPVFGGLNIEDIETPKVLEIVDRLNAELDIPVFHDDQHGTAVVTLAALLNAMRLTKREPENTSVVVAGAGSAGYGIVKILKEIGVQDITVTDSQGVISKARDLTTMNKYKLELAEMTDRDGSSKAGLATLADAVKGRDAFIGVSGIKGLLTGEMVASMNRDAIVFPLTNPDPEIHPRTAAQAGARVIATGSYKFENRANNALVFPFTMRAILDNRIRNIDQKLLVAVANALADLVPKDKLAPFNILPDVTDKRIQPAVTRAVQGAK
ncbi:NADP-dependent malic enzyme [Nitrososphaera sp.]|uniref:NAD(P)-dependent malic enzyme n=1 Tax=Nitrososphaera sp. TaxID=1971748 RepID=UPI00307F51DC